MPIINSVIAGGGTTPTGTKNITTNGTHDVAAYEYADVQVPTTAPAHYIEKIVTNGSLISGGQIIDLTGVTSIPLYGLIYAYYNADLTGQSVDFSGITSVGNSSLSGCFALSKLNSFKMNTVTSVGGSSFSFAFNAATISSVEFNGIQNINATSCFERCFENSTITSASFSNLEIISAEKCFRQAFYNCSQLQSVDFSKLTQIKITDAAYYMFYNCSALVSVDLNNLTLISGASLYTTQNGACNSMFYNCGNIQYVGLKKLQSIQGHTTRDNGATCGYMFYNCSSLPSQKFESLSDVQGGMAMYRMFGNCTSLLSLWFYALKATSFGSITTQFTGMLNGVTGCTVHFPMAIQATIGSWSDVTNGFGGTSTTVLFDIVTSLTGADTVTYTRQEKDSTSTATAWNDGNDVLFYTSGVSDQTNGVNEPVVGDTIYSDAACTTAVTTISAIA